MLRHFIHAALLISLSFSSYADVIQFKESPNTEHVVVKGDTLWDISAKFLKDPWLWPAVWNGNAYIKNPHLIYPGDVIRICLVDGEQRLCVNGADSDDGKWQPRMRLSDFEKEAIAMIPLSDIRPFLMYPLVLTEEQLENSPYIVHLEGQRLIAEKGTKLYARSIKNNYYENYISFRPGNTYTDPETEEILGHEAIYLGTNKLLIAGDPATLKIIESVSEVKKGDRVMPRILEEEVEDFFPFAPKKPLHAQIISVFKDHQTISQYDVVVLNKGLDDDFKKGHILSVLKVGQVIHDPYAEDKDEQIKLPDEMIGTVMVFRSFKRVSYALVMSATNTISLLDKVQTPE